MSEMLVPPPAKWNTLAARLHADNALRTLPKPSIKNFSPYEARKKYPARKLQQDITLRTSIDFLGLVAEKEC